MKARKESGFTLVELLVAVGIIGILASLAIPQYSFYKRDAVDSQIQSDLHTATQAMEAYFTENGNSYAGANTTNIESYGYRPTENVQLWVWGMTDPDRFLLLARKAGGCGWWWFWSDRGQIENGCG